ncbi:GAP family protein [Nocardia sp. NBC_01388]|uniref:GAP family protein n=1 Tax=Nocardia sp. NBC_01388 TaxID=2903596 RepID=UPI0032481707
MGNAIGQVIDHGVGIAISPAALVAMIVILTSRRGRPNGLAFALGWSTAIGVTVAALIVFNGYAAAHRDGTVNPWVFWVKGALGIALLLLAARQFRLSLGRSPRVVLPARLRDVNGLTPQACLLLGATIALANPKNVTQIISASVTVAGVTPGHGERAVAAAVFVAIASLCVLIPLTLHLADDSRASATLRAWRRWTDRNNSAIMAVLFLVLGARSLGAAISGLA